MTPALLPPLSSVSAAAPRPPSSADPHVAACAKRYRLSDENRDAPAYSQRQLEFLEQRKDAEAGRLRAEFAEALARKDGEIAGMTAEHVRVLEAFRVLRDEFDKAAGENKILKKAVAIQHDKQKQHDAQMAAFVDAAAKAAEHIKRIEQTNYALRAHLAAAGNSPGGDFAPPRPHLF